MKGHNHLCTVVASSAQRGACIIWQEHDAHLCVADLCVTCIDHLIINCSNLLRQRLSLNSCDVQDSAQHKSAWPESACPAYA